MVKTRLNLEVENLKSELIPFTDSDMEKAVKLALKVGQSGYWVGEQIKEYSKEFGISLYDIDPYYVTDEAVYQGAKDIIYEVTEIDIGNYSSFPQGEYDKLTHEQKTELKEDGFFMYFADKINLEI